MEIIGRHFDDELRNLHAKLLDMATFAQKALISAVEALSGLDEAKAQAVIEADRTMDERELEVDDLSIELIARHQPMANDLRFIIAAMKINADLERMADLAVDIAQRALELVGQPLLKPLIDIPKLSIVAQTMIKDVVCAFINRDVRLAKNVILADAEADRLRDLVQTELMAYMVMDGATAPRAVPLLLVARHLERICDHATNIAEDVVYLVEAKVVKHHPEALG